MKAVRVKELLGLTDGRPVAPIWWVVAIAVGVGGNVLAERAELPAIIQSMTLVWLVLGCLVLSPTRADRRNDFSTRRLEAGILVPTLLLAVAAGPPIADVIGVRRWPVVVGIVSVALLATLIVSRRRDA